MTDMTVEHAMQLADLLYSAGYDARHKERDYDPRGCGAWQDVVEALTAPRVDAGDARDAERYRWLRKALLGADDDPIDHLLLEKEPETEVEFDAAVDAAIAAIDLDVDSMRGETS